MRVVAVATSGGRDSTALLHCSVHAAAQLGLSVLALHVNHGLMPEADDWMAHVRRQARRWGAAFDHRCLSTSPPPGASIEAWARQARYAALAEMARAAGSDLLLLAHHRRDQAETWLLQALRGGGPAGLAAMAPWSSGPGFSFARPWLDLPREAIDAYVRRHRLRHIEDLSNADPRFARNRLRLKVWPALVKAFPDAEIAFTAAAARAQEAAALADEMQQFDLTPLLIDGALDVRAWALLPPARRRNALRGWLRLALGRGAAETLLVRLCLELPAARSGGWPAPQSMLRLYQGRLSVQHAAVQLPTLAPAPTTLNLQRPGRYPAPEWGGSWVVESAQGPGIPAARLQAVQVRAREGGERFKLTPGGTPRSLKKQYQTRGIPAWQRSGPLLFGGDGRLLFAPGLGLDAGSWAQPGEAQLQLRWEPDSAAPTGMRQSDR